MELDRVHLRQNPQACQPPQVGPHAPRAFNLTYDHQLRSRGTLRAARLASESHESATGPTGDCIRKSGLQTCRRQHSLTDHLRESSVKLSLTAFCIRLLPDSASPGPICLMPTLQ